MMPAFYGLDTGTATRLADGEIGRRINRAIEAALDVVVLGGWIGSGHAHLFSTDRPLTRIDDIKGLRIRIPGGLANADRLKVFEAQPLTIPWPDFPAALDRRQVDGVLTTFEAVVNGQLWDHGLRYGLEDAEYYSQYIPVVSRGVWNRLAADLRETVEAAWSEIVPIARRAARISQAEARDRLDAERIVMASITADDRAVARVRLLERQAGLAAALGVDPALVALATELAAATGR
jgi:TRAP-type C4-dicarboxylate transport system substrate-binding protein